jgi:riboflavin synthase
MVFSGIVESMGTVVSLERRDDLVLWDGSTSSGVVLTVADALAVEGAELGCSIAVNGTCLTVTRLDAGAFAVGLAPETLRRTNLGALAPGSRVNLERSLAAGARNSGHLVQGHVDGTGVVAATWREGDSLWFRVRCARALLRYIVPKGYVAIDGTSLTVCEVTEAEGADAAASGAEAAGGAEAGTGTFTFMLIEFTQKKVVVAHRAVGDRVNIEVDVIGKLVERSAAAAVADALREGREREARLEGLVAALAKRVDLCEAAMAAAAAR